jgi:hypothetical protein
VGGAVPVRDLLAILEAAGFEDVEYVGKTGVTTSKFTEGALFKAVKPGPEQA